MIPILDSAAMRAADAAAIAGGVASETLMENAARGVVETIAQRFPAWRRVVVACGPGNNGGDGLAAARMLAARGLAVRVFTLRDPERFRGDPATNALRAREAGLLLESLEDARGLDAFRDAASAADGIVDALFGTGLDRPLTGRASEVVEAIDAAGPPVTAADVPSGLSSDSAGIPGPSVRAAVTVAFGAAKVCHAFPPARRRCGRVVIHDIGIPPQLLAPPDHRLFLATPDAVRERLPTRDPGAHKGAFGRVAIVAGSRGKTGAAVLAARGALRAGAGLVTVLCARSLEHRVVAALPEAMTDGLPEDDGRLAATAGPELVRRLQSFDAAVVGPGLTTAPETVAAIEEVVRKATLPIALDADALNAYAGRAEALRERAGPTVATPHPGEAGRLLGRSAKDVQADRLAAARELAAAVGSPVLLKGEASLTASVDGRVVVNPTGTPLLATAGSGDVLAGVLAAFLAAGLDPATAAWTAAWLHGEAGERLERTLGDAGLLAREIADAVPGARRELRKSGNGKTGTNAT